MDMEEFVEYLKSRAEFQKRTRKRKTHSSDGEDGGRRLGENPTGGYDEPPKISFPGESSESKSETGVIDRVQIGFPRKYNVVFHNDDVTPIGFVVELLVNIFNHERGEAMSLALEIHQHGKAVVASYIKSIAEAKVTLVREVCEKAEYPLHASVEPAQ